MLRSFFRNPKWAAWAYGGGAFLIASIYLQVQMTVLLNGWYNRFYTLLQEAPQHNVSEFWAMIFQPELATHNFLGFIDLPMPSSFMWIAIPYVLLATATSYVTRLYGFRWRQAITENYIPRWRKVEHEIEGASQRIQEDAMRFSSIVESLGLAIVRAVMTLIAFIPILWTLSAQVDLPIIRDIPGSLVWASVGITLGGMLISWFVGWFLPGLEYNNQKVEAAFRKELVLGEDDKIGHAQPETLFSLFFGIKLSYHRLYLHYGYFDLWSNLYGQVTSLTPLLMVGPGMFTGAVTFGLLNQVSDAYSRVDGAFGLILNNWTTLTELRSIWKRLHEFEANLDRYDTGHDVSDAEPASPVPAE
jgi:peptide/bleomycin uptake transporter